MCKFFLTILLFAGLISQGQTPMRMLVKKKAIVYQNLVMYSEQIDNADYSATNATILANQATDLTGGVTMEKITTTVTSHAVQYNGNGNYLITTGGTTYRFSFDVIRGTMTDMKYSVYDRTHGSDIVAATSYYSSTSATVQRVSFSFTVPAGCTMVGVYFVRDSGVTGTVFVGRAQVETNGGAYITTTSSLAL